MCAPASRLPLIPSLTTAFQGLGPNDVAAAITPSPITSTARQASPAANATAALTTFSDPPAVAGITADAADDPRDRQLEELRRQLAEAERKAALVEQDRQQEQLRWQQLQEQAALVEQEFQQERQRWQQLWDEQQRHHDRAASRRSSSGASTETNPSDRPHSEPEDVKPKLRIAYNGRRLARPSKFGEPFVLMTPHEWLSRQSTLQQVALSLYNDGYALEDVSQLQHAASQPVPAQVRCLIEASPVVRTWLSTHTTDVAALLDAFFTATIVVALPAWFQHWGVTTMSGYVAVNGSLLASRYVNADGRDAQCCIVLVHELGHFAPRWATQDPHPSPPRGEGGAVAEHFVFGAAQDDATDESWKWVIDALGRCQPPSTAATSFGGPRRARIA